MRALKARAQWIFVFLAVAAGSAFGSAGTIFITADGNPAGNCTTDVRTPAFFNSSANWGTSSTQIGPGTTVLLCGTFTFPAGTNGAFHMTNTMSGAAGNPVLIKFDAGAIVQSDAFADNGAFQFDGNSYVTLDGGTTCGLVNGAQTACNGLIQNLRNGVSAQTCAGGPCTQNINSSGVSGGAGAHDIEVRNLNVRYIYMELGSQGSAAGWASYDVIFYANTQRLSIHNNALTEGHDGVTLDFDYGSFNTVEVYNNYIAHHAFGVGVGNGSNDSYSAQNIFIHDNEITNWDDWNLNFNTYHTDGLHGFTLGGGTGIFTIYFYNNYVHGNLTGNSTSAGTAFAYCDLVSGGNIVTANQTCYIFNNVFDASTAQYTAWNVSDFMNQSQYYNNTLVGTGTIGDFAFMPNGQVRGSIMKNNVLANWSTAYEAIYESLPTAIAQSDYNVFYNCTGTCFSGVGNLAQWQATGYDTHSKTGNPAFAANYHLGSGSSAIGAATNLSALCSGQPVPGLGALCYDKAGVARPSTGAWDAGAYDYQSSTLAPPTPVSVVVQ